MLEKRKKYGELVRNLYHPSLGLPTISDKILFNSQSVDRYRKGELDMIKEEKYKASERKKYDKKQLSSRLSEYSQPPPQPSKFQEKQNRSFDHHEEKIKYKDYLAELRERQKPKSNKQPQFQFLDQYNSWQKEIENPNLPVEEKIQKIYQTNQLLAKQTEQTEQKYNGRSSQNKGKDIQDNYINSIKARLALLESLHKQFP